MPGQRVKIGPWAQGLNQRDDAELIQPNQLAKVVNFDIEADGSLFPRRACRKASAPTGFTGTPTFTSLGSVQNLGSEQAVFFGTDGTTSKFLYTEDPTGAWSTSPFSAIDSGTYSEIVQYNNFLYFVPTTDGKGFRTSGLSSSATAVATIPGGRSALMIKDRMFVIGQTRVYYSKATDPTIFAAPDGGFFDVNPGDGQEIIRSIVQNNTLYLFKRSSTWVFTFATDPAVDGVLRLISSDMGALDAVIYNNEMYTVDGRSVHQFVNNYFRDIGEMLNFVETDTLDTSNAASPRLNVIDRSLIIGPTTSGRFYHMNLDTGAWSEHVYSSGISPSDQGVRCRGTMGSFTLFSNTNSISYIKHTRAKNNVIDTDSTGANRYPGYRFETKEWAFDTPDEWKRLYWWSFDGDSPSTPFPASPVMVVNGSTVSHGSLKVYDRTVTVSARFRKLVLGFDSPAAAATSATQQAAPVYRTLNAYVVMKAPIST